MGEQEINRFLTHLAVNENVAASTQNQALCAIVFLYKHVLKQEVGDLGEEVVWAKKPKRLALTEGGKGGWWQVEWIKKVWELLYELAELGLTDRTIEE